MTNEELKAAIEKLLNYADGKDVKDDGVDWVYLHGYIYTAIQAARELSQLKDGTHPDMVMVPREPTIDMIVKANITIRQYALLIAAAQKGNV